MWHGTEWFLMLMAHKTTLYKMWYLDYPLLAIPMNVCTRTSGWQWCFEHGYACAAPSRCSQNLYPCTTMLIYQKHDPHRIDEVFGQLLKYKAQSRVHESHWTYSSTDSFVLMAEIQTVVGKQSPSFLSRALRRVVITLLLGKAVRWPRGQWLPDHIRELGTSAKQSLFT